MPQPEKEITCQCGHSMTIKMNKMRCVKCGKHVFYTESEQRRHRLGIIYAVAIFVSVTAFITYLFIEMIVTPLFG
jgi:uncharacterized paraquat-inducible protein A